MIKRCIVCNKKLPLGKSSRGMCKRDYDQWRYKNVPEVKKYHRKYYKKYYREHKLSGISG